MTGVLEDGLVRSFHDEAAGALLAHNQLQLHYLRLNGQVIAAAYCLKDKRRTALYITGYDPTFKAISPGTLLIAHAIETAIREGSAIFDFLRGEEHYKKLWGAEAIGTCGLEIGR